MPNSEFRKDRHSIRLSGHDYSYVGVYFITVCTADRQHLFGEVENGRMVLNEVGEVASRCWRDLPQHFPHAHLDAWVVMPNHVHGIIVIGFDGHGPGVVCGANIGASENPVVVGSGIDHVVMPDAVVGAENIPPLRNDRQYQTGKHGQPNGHRNESPSDALTEHHWPARPNGTTRTIGSMVRGFKIGVTNWFQYQSIGDTIWQRNWGNTSFAMKMAWTGSGPTSPTTPKNGPVIA